MSFIQSYEPNIVGDKIMNGEPKVLCKTPTPNKKGTRILKWKYDLIRSAILKVVPQDKVGILFNDLPKWVKE
jgi:hypothetical protein